jgi:hypothetical protein
MARPLTRLPLVAGIAAGLVAGGLTTAIAINGETIDPPPRIAFVARSDNPADALAAGPVAGQLGAPLFVTPTGTLVDAAKAGLIAYAPELVIITGGFAAISAETEAAIEAAIGLPDDKVVRARGDDRHETAVAIVNLLAAYNPAYLPVDAKALTAESADSIGGLTAADLVTRDDLGAYYAEMDKGDAPLDFYTVGPFTLTLTCVDVAGSTQGRVEVSSDVAPWFLWATEYGTPDTIELANVTTAADNPDFSSWYPTVSAPSTGTYVVDDGFRNALYVEFPGADCRVVGHILPNLVTAG